MENGTLLERGNIQGRIGSERGKESERSLHKLGITVSRSNERSMGEVSRTGGALAERAARKSQNWTDPHHI